MAIFICLLLYLFKFHTSALPAALFVICALTTTKRQPLGSDDLFIYPPAMQAVIHTLKPNSNDCFIHDPIVRHLLVAICASRISFPWLIVRFVSFHPSLSYFLRLPPCNSITLKLLNLSTRRCSKRSFKALTAKLLVMWYLLPVCWYIS